MTALEGFGYTDNGFFDPMEPRWRAKPYQLTDLRARTGPFTDTAIVANVETMARANPYPNPEKVEAALRDYWAARKKNSRDEEDLEVRQEEGPEPARRFRRFQV